MVTNAGKVPAQLICLAQSRCANISIYYYVAHNLFKSHISLKNCAEIQWKRDKLSTNDVGIIRHQRQKK